MIETLKRMFRGESDVDFIGRTRLWLTISGVVLLISLLSVFLRPTENPCRALPTKGLNCGIEFNGGLAITAPVPDDGPLGEAEDLDVISTVRGSMEDAGEPDAQVQVSESGGERQVLVQTRQVSSEQERQELIAAVGDTVGADLGDTASESISASFGGEVTGKAVRALVVFLVVIMAFMSWRFEWKMGAAALAALFHDLIITAGIYSLVGFEVTPSTVVAILTILGYSLYDNVVVFDKVEENTALMAASGRTTYRDAANHSLNEVFMRSLNTALTTLIPVSALLFVGAGLLGASTMEDLALALLIGLLAGAYSSVFFATPILVILKEREPKYRMVREKVLREARSRSKEQPEGERVPAPVGGGEAAAKKSGSAATGGRPKTAPPRGRIGTKKAKRRRNR
ncbi:MAG: protein translocase subunit SecF [Actinomycetota bacterium]